MKRAFLVALIFTVMTPSAFAAEGITRRDAFVMMWNTIKRPTEETREKPYTDVPNGAVGFAEITYAKARGILSDETETFRPDEPITLEEALIMLLRTRNIEPPDEITPETLPAFVERYPIRSVNAQNRAETLTTEELMNIMNLLDTKLKTEDHEVSLYAEKFHGKGTAFGESFDMYAMTAAHRTFPHNTLVKVTNIENQKSVIVRINDRGPYVVGRDMDLSLAAFTSIAERSKGKFRATFERLGDVTFVDPSLLNQTIDQTETPSPAERSTDQPAVVPVVCDEHPAVQRRVSGGVVLTPGLPSQLSLGKSITLTSTKSFVVRGVTYPDGTRNLFQDWVLPRDHFSFKPSVTGTYVFQIGSLKGRSKMMKVGVAECQK